MADGPGRFATRRHFRRCLAGIGGQSARNDLAWDRKTGEPVYNAIVWQDRRTADFCDELKADEATSRLIQEKTGLVIDAYFSASKIRWILNHVDDARTRAENGELAFGTVDSWLVWKLTNGKRHITDASNASRTMLFDLHAMDWDATLCDLFQIPASMLPTVVPNSGNLAEAKVFDVPVPITGIAGDQQAALFGQQCTRPGMVKNTYGTGCFAMNTGSRQCRPACLVDHRGMATERPNHLRARGQCIHRRCGGAVVGMN